jgi:uncharacterized protein YjbI with pentapeptide repeats
MGMPNQLYVPVTKPISVWNKPLKADFKEFFTAISKAVIDVVVGKWDSAAANTVDALAAVGFEEEPGQIAWLLIRRALIWATFDLVQENVHLLVKGAPTNPDEFCDTLDLSLESVEMTIDKAFFKQPAELPVLSAFKTPFKQWLKGYGLTDAQADTIVARLPSYFVFALNHEWRRQPQTYALIKDSMETPFTRAGEREQEWMYYASWLQKQIHESLFNEAFSLKQIYVPLRAYYLQDSDGDTNPGDTLSGKRDKVQIATDLQTELDGWVARAQKDDAIRVISGGPGSGKSSFSRIYAAHQTSNNQLRVLYIPLHQFDPKNDLASGIHEFFRVTKLLSHSPLDPDTVERLLIIFDGLDELAMQGTVGTETAREFIDHVTATVGKYNYQQLRLQVLLTGRELVVQANASKFRKEAQVLHVLPYFLTKYEQEAYHDPHNLLEGDQRLFWWQQYGTVTGKTDPTMPKALQRDDLQDITAQPLLNYLVALSYERGELDFSTQVNLNEIYQDLLEAVYERDYEGGIHPGVRDLPFDHFIRILEEIGLATWHGDGRTTTIREVQQHCKIAGLSALLDAFKQGAEVGVARLLTAFYFRQHENRRDDGEQTFEFTHKSFSEYLTARRIVGALSRIHSQIMLRKKSYEEGWDEREALKYWATLYGNAPRMTNDLFRFVQSEVRLQEKATAAGWQQTLSKLISWMLQHGMPMELLDPRPSYHKENTAAIHAEEALLAALYACATVTEQVSKIDWFQESDTAAGDWISRLQGQHANTLTRQCLGWLDLRDCMLELVQLFEANLRNTILEKADLGLAILALARLEDANLHLADLSRINLELANLNRANLDGAVLDKANLSQADLIGANLRRANLHRANLERANLREANLEGANLHEANLEGAKLNGAVLPDGSKWTHDTDMRRFTHPNEEHDNEDE